MKSLYLLSVQRFFYRKPHAARWLGLAVLGFLLVTVPARAQIYAPEGLNMPGSWNAWTNPPTNNLAFASSTQVADGRIELIDVGTTRWQTIFEVAATGGDIPEGTYTWLFTSGPDANAFANKWGDVTVTLNTLQEYTFQGTADNSVSVTNNHWYSVVWEDDGYENTRAIFMETTNEPVDILTVSFPTTVLPDEAVTVNITTNSAISPEELVYLRYTTDDWNTSDLLIVTMNGTNGSAIIPGQPDMTTVNYYVFTSTVSGITEDYDMFTIKLNNNDGSNYEYSIGGGATPVIGWANLQYPASGTIMPGDSYEVYAQVYIEGVTDQAGQGADVQAWIGYSTTDSDPATWTDWIASDYSGDVGSNDEYMADLGAALSTEGTYYYASRFQYLDQGFVYGGYSASGGGFWDGADNVSGVLTISSIPPEPGIDWANIQWPGSGTIMPNDEFLVYAQVFALGVTDAAGQGAGIQAWIGYNTEDSDPETWSNWILADFNADAGNNDEYVANLGAVLSDEGTYYYASKFQYLSQDEVFGGYSDGGGGFWDGTANVSGVLQVTGTPPDPQIDWANLQYPGNGTIEIGQEYMVYAQAYIANITGQDDPAAGLQAWIGYSLNDTDPSTWTDWISADYLGASGSNDEFVADLGAQTVATGTYYYASRFQYLDQGFVYGGFSENGGGFWDGTNNVSGILTVVNELVSYPVTFSVTDATGLYSNIKFKGSMTDWEPVDMVQNGNLWTVTLDIYPGSYEWGIFEDDGSPDGIWLVIGPNLMMTVAEDGIVSGDITYVITFVGIDEQRLDIGMYPNPTSGHLILNRGDVSEKAIVQLYQYNGVRLLSTEISSPQAIVDLTALTPGIYLVKVVQGQQQFIRQIIRR